MIDIGLMNFQIATGKYSVFSSLYKIKFNSTSIVINILTFQVLMKKTIYFSNFIE